MLLFRTFLSRWFGYDEIRAARFSCVLFLCALVRWCVGVRVHTECKLYVSIRTREISVLLQ